MKLIKTQCYKDGAQVTALINPAHIATITDNLITFTNGETLDVVGGRVVEYLDRLGLVDSI